MGDEMKKKGVHVCACVGEREKVKEKRQTDLKMPNS